MPQRHNIDFQYILTHLPGTMTKVDSRTPRSILLITNIENGESNVFLATAQALLEADADVELHFATFAGLEAAVASTWERAKVNVPHAKPIVFHAIDGLSMGDGLRHYFATNTSMGKDAYLPDSFLAKPGLSNTIRAIRDIVPIFVPYDGPQLAKVVSSIVDIINTVGSDLVVVNSLMTPALTACYHLGVQFACLSPNAIKEFAGPSQPHGASLWKYPAPFSGFPYPVPWHCIPLNIMFLVYMIVTYARDTRRQDVAKHLEASTGATLRTPIDLLKNLPPGLRVLVSTLPELDFEAVIPAHVLPCGPIIRNAPPVSEVDPALHSWLSRGPTIYINLGSICRLDERRAEEFALGLSAALKTALGQAGNTKHKLQVLWKLKKHGQYDVTEAGGRIHGILGEEIDADLIRIVDWIVPEPISILESGHIACAVHHGGANSFNEAVVSGVPQVVLPQWTDCYDYAQRVEMLGIGKLGNRAAKPHWTAQELSHSLSAVLCGEGAETISRKAKNLAAACKENGNGATNAARILLG